MTYRVIGGIQISRRCRGKVDDTL